MNRTPIYVGANFCIHSAFLNRGEAINRFGRYFEECELLFVGKLEDHLKTENAKIYRAHQISQHGEIVCSPWCLSEDVARDNLAEGGEDLWYEVARLEKPYLSPVEFPCEAFLLQTEKGLMCRLNLHPELDGTGHQGKIFFPDRSCKNLAAGPVVITEANDKGSYGFFKGFMKQFSRPADEKIADHLEVNELWDVTLDFFSGLFGNFVRLTRPNFVAYLVADDAEDLLVTFQLSCLDNIGDLVESVSAQDFLCQGYQGHGADDLLNQFVPCKFEPYNSDRSPKFLSAVFDDAQKGGFLTLRRAENIDYISVDPGLILWAARSFSREEMQELIEICGKINSEANKVFTSRLRSGKMNLR